MASIFLTLAIVAGVLTGANKVKVDLYYEAGCPFCLAFIDNILLGKDILGVLDDVIDFEGHPFGNAYFVTAECGGAGAYQMNARLCYEKQCGLANLGSASDDCFTGELVCQHGESECKFNRAEACVKALGASPKLQMQFFSCIGKGAGYAANMGTEASLIRQCARKTGVTWGRKGQRCWTGRGKPSGAELIRKEAAVTPEHPSVPYVVVNGKAIEDHDKLLEEVCAVYEGAPVAACAQFRQLNAIFQ